MYKPEIGEVLTRHLGRVEAPEELWERIENSQGSARVPTRPARLRALIAVAVMMAIVGIVVHKNSMTPRVSKAPEALNSTCQLCHAGA